MVNTGGVTLIFCDLSGRIEEKKMICLLFFSVKVIFLCGKNASVAQSAHKSMV